MQNLKENKITTKLFEKACAKIFANIQGWNNIVSLEIVSPLCSNLSLRYAKMTF